ncbi:MAG: PEP-CTERM/exosortase system-associated acyltransferase [Gammaproteobacteria bacterium]|jgi:N-acyl amino acid synthase of PEP-CTERM/exosortase system|nr:PEP-CTERM/exosortase system-associated acyltransferase [Gammaproteobacteria bacterium]
MSEKPPSLANAFEQFFEIIPADTDALRDVVYQIRYQVYCKEMHFEKEEDFPNGRETDEFDPHSIHALLRHRPSGEFAGCVRLVLNRSDKKEPQLPLECHCSHSLDQRTLDLNQLDRRTFGEISRLAIISRFRRRPGEASTPHGVADETASLDPSERRVFPHIALGLYLAAAAVSLQRGMTMVVVMMEPRLARHMRYFGINFVQAGDVIDHHGMRGPFFITKESLYQNIRPEIGELLTMVGRPLAAAKHPQSP